MPNYIVIYRSQDKKPNDNKLQLRNSITTNVEETDSGIVATCNTNCEYAP